MLNGGYFKGWYFKCCTEDKTVAFIPAFHRTDSTKIVSLQIITDGTAFSIPFNSLEYCETPLYIKLGNCVFSEDGIVLNLSGVGQSIHGELHFGALSPIRYDIMGPFKYVPFMQCRHSVYSMSHRVDGHLTIGGQHFDFQNGVGYIEGDRGRSFPKEYIWTQCCFQNGSVMLSVADIPFFGIHFTGIIGVIWLDGREYRIATYLGADVKHIGENTVTVEQGDYRLTATLISRNEQVLFAPVNGKMSRTIHESASCKAYYRFSKKGVFSHEFTSDRASFEFEYNRP